MASSGPGRGSRHPLSPPWPRKPGSTSPRSKAGAQQRPKLRANHPRIPASIGGRRCREADSQAVARIVNNAAADPQRLSPYRSSRKEHHRSRGATLSQRGIQPATGVYCRLALPKVRHPRVKVDTQRRSPASSRLADHARQRDIEEQEESIPILHRQLGRRATTRSGRRPADTAIRRVEYSAGQRHNPGLGILLPPRNRALTARSCILTPASLILKGEGTQR